MKISNKSKLFCQRLRTEYPESRVAKCHRYISVKILAGLGKTSSQAPSYASPSPKLSPTDRLTGVRCRATSVAKK